MALETREVTLSRPDPRPHVTKQLDRKLGLASVFAISVGAMLGSGIFVLPGLAAARASPWVSLSYLLAGVLVLPGLLSKAELATAMPVAGGVYVYIDRSMGPWAGTIAGLGTWLSLSSKTAFALVGLGAYLVLFTAVSPLPVSLVILGLLLGLNLLGAGKVSGLQVLVVMVTITALATLSALGVPRVDPAHFEPPFPAGLHGLVTGAGFVFVSYAGVTKVCSVAEEVRNPERNIPLGMLAAQVTVMVLYAVVAWVMVGAVPMEELTRSITPVAATGGRLFGPRGQTTFAVVAIIGLVSMSNAGILSTTRFPFAMGRDRLLPPRFSTISERFGTPTAAIFLTGLLLLALVTFLPVEKLAKLASGFKIFLFGVNCLAVIVLRESGARWYKPSFRSPFYPWTQLAGLIGGGWLLYQMGPFALVGIVGSIVLGTAWYWGYARARVTRKSVIPLLVGETRALKATQVAERDEQDPSRRPQVIVPVFGGEPAPARLVRLAAAFVDKGPLEVLRLEEVPEGASLASALAPDAKADALARDAVDIGLDAHVKVSFHDLLTHNAKEALHRRALGTGSDWVVMERPTRRELHYLVRHPMAWWLDHPPCHLGIFLDRGGGERDFDTADDFPRILVVPQPGPYDTLIVYVADKLARGQRRGRVTLAAVVYEDATLATVKEQTRYLEQVGRLCKGYWNTRIERAPNRVDAIAAMSADYDLLVLGSPGGLGLRTLFLPSFEHRVAELARCSVLRVRTGSHRALHEVAFIDEETGRFLVLDPFLRAAAVVPRVRATRKPDLFATMAHHLGEATGADPAQVERALWKVEERQNTSLAQGVAVAAPVLDSVEMTTLGAFTTEEPVDYRGRGRPRVDVVVAVLAPPRARQTQLWLMERLTRMALDTTLAERLRFADSAEAMRNAVRLAAGEIGEMTEERTREEGP